MAASCEAHRKGGLHCLLRKVADARGDVEGFIASLEASGLSESAAKDAASRPLAASRPDEALAWLDRHSKAL